MHRSLAHPLWQRVRHHPDDDLAWRVLGDWLCERGDRLGRLVMNAFRNDPASLEERSVLQRQLRDDLFDGWTAGVTLAFGRGLPTEVSVTALPGTTGLAERLDRLLARPACAVLEGLHLHAWPDVELRATLASLVRHGPHPALRAVTLTSATGQGRAPLHQLGGALPGLTSLKLGLHPSSLARPARFEARLQQLDLEALRDAEGIAAMTCILTAPGRFPALVAVSGPSELVSALADRGVVRSSSARVSSIPAPPERTVPALCGCADCQQALDPDREVDEMERLEERYRRGELTWTQVEARLS